MTGAELCALREGAGMGVREISRALGITHTAVGRYEAAERPIPPDVERAVRVLVPGAAETSNQKIFQSGVSAASNASVSATGVSASLRSTPATGVPAAPSVNSAARHPGRARRIDVRALLGSFTALLQAASVPLAGLLESARQRGALW